MDLSGLTDFPVSSIDAYNQCRCGSVARVRSGQCVACLLQDALEGDQLDDVALELELAAINVPDRDWRLGNFQILEEIARGGMGVVYRARHLPSGRVVALKRMLTYHSDSQQTLARFQREAEAAASLDHPNILPVYDVGITDDGLPYFSMKFAAAGSLLNNREFFRNQPRRSAELVVKVARAIAYAHSRGLVHRDLKPGNILLDSRDEPLVADFGLAKWLDGGTDLTCTLTVFGTAGYIAPEQVQGSRAAQKPAVDVYSLGAIFFELLSGRPPFLGEHAIDVICQASESAPPKLRSVAPAASRDLETICARCLDRNPEARYESAGGLAEDIERWLGNRPILARRISRPARTWQWARRNPALATSIVACSLASFAAVAWQVDNWRLEKQLRSDELVRHSVVVLPFLDLDEAAVAAMMTRSVAESLQARMSAVGPSKVVSLPASQRNWTGAGTPSEVQSAIKETNVRAALVGMYRRMPQGVRVSLHLVQADGEIAQSWKVELPHMEETTQALTARDLGSAIYNVLDRRKAISARQPDPTLLESTARGYFNAGRALLDRRTISDADRAIKCFEGAVNAAPKSPMAHAYLAMAYMGRNFLGANPAYIDRAYAQANEAIKISPDDPSGHRALCGLDNFVGRLDEALEHGFRALECGDQSERALGQIAYIWEELGRPDKAIQWFSKAKLSKTQPADYDAILGDAWMLLTCDDKAEEVYKTSSNFRPDLPEGWLGLCNLKLLHREFEEARTLFQKHAVEYAAFHTTKSFQAHLEFFARNYAEAERLYNEVLKADPLGVGAQQYGAISSMAALARLKIIGGDVAGADGVLKQCLVQDQAELATSPRHPEGLYRLAADEAIQGNKEAALVHLKASITAGFLDYRSAQMDPRFDSLAEAPEFKQLLSELAARVARLRESTVTATLN